MYDFDKNIEETLYCVAVQSGLNKLRPCVFQDLALAGPGVHGVFDFFFSGAVCVPVIVQHTLVHIPVVDKGLQEALPNGVLAGYPLIDIKATLFDGSYHDVDSSEMAYKVAASLALKEAAKKCKPVLLEPIMKVDVVVPDEYLGNVMGDLTSRRGKPMGNESRGNALQITAMVPLAEMFGYATTLRSNSQGRGTFTLFMDHYEEVPKNIAEEIIKKNSAK